MILIVAVLFLVIGIALGVFLKALLEMITGSASSADQRLAENDQNWREGYQQLKKDYEARLATRDETILRLDDQIKYGETA